MLNFQIDSRVRPIQASEKRVDYPELPDYSVLALVLRTIPLAISFVLFILAASIDAHKWGSRSIQIILATAACIGVVGVALFIPKRL